MNFFVVPREIGEINKRGDQISCGGSPKITKKHPTPVYFEPESSIALKQYFGR